jgi:hypothetical protein
MPPLFIVIIIKWCLCCSLDGNKKFEAWKFEGFLKQSNVYVLGKWVISDLKACLYVIKLIDSLYYYYCEDSARQKTNIHVIEVVYGEIIKPNVNHFFKKLIKKSPFEIFRMYGCIYGFYSEKWNIYWWANLIYLDFLPDKITKI